MSSHASFPDMSDDSTQQTSTAHSDILHHSLCDPTPMDVDDVDNVTWTIVENSSRQRHPKLTNSIGFSYNVKRKNKNGSVDWQCCKRSRSAVMCRATVKQVGDNFIPGTAEHCHPAEPNTTTVHQIQAAVMEGVILLVTVTWAGDAGE